jgi:hypothetical protein
MIRFSVASSRPGTVDGDPKAGGLVTRSTMLFRDILAWLAVVFRERTGWVGGSAIAALLVVGQVLGLWTPKKRAYVYVIALGVGFSMFQAWRHEHGVRLKLEEDKRVLQEDVMFRIPR